MRERSSGTPFLTRSAPSVLNIPPLAVGITWGRLHNYVLAPNAVLAACFELLSRLLRRLVPRSLLAVISKLLAEHQRHLLFAVSSGPAPLRAQGAA
jgi:hypothetical protein